MCYGKGIRTYDAYSTKRYFTSKTRKAQFGWKYINQTGKSWLSEVVMFLISVLQVPFRISTGTPITQTKVLTSFLRQSRKTLHLGTRKQLLSSTPVPFHSHPIIPQNISQFWNADNFMEVTTTLYTNVTSCDNSLHAKLRQFACSQAASAHRYSNFSSIGAQAFQFSIS